MSEEEKDIEIVKEITFVRGIRKDVEGEREDLLALEEVLNLIDKLQKDNYELDRENQHYFDRIQDLQKEIKSKNKQIKLMQEMNLPKEIEINYISKDIIKKLIEDKKQIGTYNIEYLKIEDIKELLGE